MPRRRAISAFTFFTRMASPRRPETVSGGGGDGGGTTTVGVYGVGAARRLDPGWVVRLPLSRYACGHAVQAQRRPSPPHPEGPLQGPELAGGSTRPGCSGAAT